MAGNQKRNAFAPIAFDKDGDVRSVVLKDSFITAQAGTAGSITSDLVWTLTAEVGGAGPDVEVLPSEAGNQGIIRLNVGATTPADGDLVSLALSGDDGIKLDGSGVYVAALLRIPDVSDTVVQFGLVADPAAVPNSSAADVVAFVFDPEDADNVGDAQFFAQVNAAGTDSEEVLSGVSYAEDEWVLLELAGDDTGATFRITTSDESQTVNIDNGSPTETLVPVFQVENVGAAEEAIEIDSFVLRYFVREDSSMFGA